MMGNMQSTQARQLQELKEEEIMPFADYMSKLGITVSSNKERQQWHQDHDATVRIQSIFCRYSAQQQLHLQMFTAVCLQTFLQGCLS
eukprot:13872425-Ditylum_brightwellii.AAC.1